MPGEGELEGMYVRGRGGGGGAGGGAPEQPHQCWSAYIQSTFSGERI